MRKLWANKFPTVLPFDPSAEDSPLMKARAVFRWRLAVLCCDCVCLFIYLFFLEFSSHAIFFSIRHVHIAEFTLALHSVYLHLVGSSFCRIFFRLVLWPKFTNLWCFVCWFGFRFFFSLGFMQILVPKVLVQEEMIYG